MPILFALLLMLTPLTAYADIISCIKTCIDSGGSTTTEETPTTGETPTGPAVVAFPNAITFDKTSDQGTGSYYGTACLLFPASWEGRIQKVIVNGEVALHGISYKGQPVFRLLKTGDNYLPATIEITATDGRQYIAKTSVDTGGSGGAAMGTTGKSSPILWKPVADSGGMLVVLLPANMGKPSVAVTDMNGNVIETGVFKYFSNPNRATYRFTRPGRSFPSPCILKVGSTLYLVRDAAKRNESLPSYIR